MKHKVLTAACILLSSCSSVQSQDAIDINTMPDWLRDALEREASSNSSTRLDIPELNVSDEVLGGFELAEQNDGFWYFVSEVEDSIPIECYVYTDFDGAANTLYYVVDQELEYIGETYEQEITDRTNFGLDVGIIGSTPYITLDTLYNVELESETRAGLVKAIVAQTSQSLQVCIHNEIGFSETFHSRAKSFISSIAKGENSDVFFEPVYKLTMNGVPVGFTRERYSFDEDGDVFLQRVQSLVVPVDESSLSRTDTSATEWSFPDGSLINANSYSVANGDVQSNLSLLVADDDWVVEGQLQGKEIKETLAHDDWILSSYGSYLSTQSLLESESSSQEFNMWIVDADPGAVTPVTLKLMTENAAANVELTMGPITMEYYSDENGIVQHGISNQANISVGLDIMSVHGAPLQR